MHYNFRLSLRIALVLSTSLSLSCSQIEEQSKKKKTNKANDATGEIPSQKPEIKNKEQEPEIVETEGGAKEGETEDEVDPEAKINALLADCGADTVDNKNPEKVIDEKELARDHIRSWTSTKSHVLRKS